MRICHRLALIVRVRQRLTVIAVKNLLKSVYVKHSILSNGGISVKLKRMIAHEIIGRPVWQLTLDDFICTALQDDRLKDYWQDELNSLDDNVLLNLAIKYHDLFVNIFNIHDWQEDVQLSIDDSDLIDDLLSALKEVQHDTQI